MILLAFAWWYFFWHQFMWLRHLAPSLLVGCAVFAHFALRGTAQLGPRRQAALLAVVAAGLTFDGVVALGRDERRAPPIPVEESYAKMCRSDTPWQVGPWPECIRLGYQALRPKR